MELHLKFFLVEISERFANHVAGVDLFQATALPIWGQESLELSEKLVAAQWGLCSLSGRQPILNLPHNNYNDVIGELQDFDSEDTLFHHSFGRQFSPGC
jgi:hypothetical protein